MTYSAVKGYHFIESIIIIPVNSSQDVLQESNLKPWRFRKKGNSKILLDDVFQIHDAQNPCSTIVHVLYHSRKRAMKIPRFGL